MSERLEARGCLGFFLHFIGIRPSGGSSSQEDRFPYRLRDDFLSPAELSFFRVLEKAVDSRFAITVKVRISDLLFVPNQEGSQGFRNRIDRKHVDFLLCDRSTMKPQLVIELDDASHNRPDRQDRDRFVDRAFAAAGLPILHIKAQRAYSVADVAGQIAASLPDADPATLSSSIPPPMPTPDKPSCPKCSTEMVERTAAKGKHAGKRFWACANYPQCRHILAID